MEVNLRKRCFISCVIQYVENVNAGHLLSNGLKMIKDLSILTMGGDSKKKIRDKNGLK